MNGKLNGLPVSTTGRLFVFNTTTWEKAGLPLPTTWEELIAAGPIFRDKLGESFYPFEATGLDASLIVQLIGTQMTGKPVVDADTGELLWSEEDFVKAIEFYRTLVDNHVIEPWEKVASAGNIVLHENPRWAKGEIGGTYQWDSTYGQISDPLEEGQAIVYTKLLTQAGQQTQGIYRKPSMVISISANSPNQEAAAEVVSCLINEEEGFTILGATRGVPASTAARDKLVADGVISPQQIEAQDLVLGAEGPRIHPIMEHPDVQSVMQDTLEQFAYGEIDAATAAEEIVWGIEEALEDVRG
jgi:oligogalacturonide transport system substrate-binding protein